MTRGDRAKMSERLKTEKGQDGQDECTGRFMAVAASSLKSCKLCRVANVMRPYLESMT